MTTSKAAIGNIFTQKVVKSLDLSKEHKPVVLTFIQPDFKRFGLIEETGNKIIFYFETL